MIERDCPLCGADLAADDVDAFVEAWVAHAEAAHGDLPYPPMAIRNYGAGLARTTGSVERLDTIGTVEVHPVSADRIDDWLALFDHDAFAGRPEWSACYCAEPHELDPSAPDDIVRPWEEKRALMIDRLRAGTSFGYLAYVDGRAAGWVNASRRCDYSLFRQGDEDDDVTVGISCFAIAPPYRGHGLSKALLDRAIADAADRGATWIEAYPFNADADDPDPTFRGVRPLYEDRGFTEVKVRARDTVVRRPAGSS